MMDAENIKKIVITSNLELSAKLIAIMHYQVELEIKIDALASLIQASGKLDSHALEVAEQYSGNKPKFVEKRKVLMECSKSVKADIEHPEERLFSIFEAALGGRN